MQTRTRTIPTGTGGSNALPVGYQLDAYTIAAVLGEGGFGITYRARDNKLGVDVAIKEYFPTVYASRAESSTIFPRSGMDEENYRWGLHEFLKEAQALAKFKHAHIVRVLRFFETNGTAYTTMEYEEGETLTSHLRKHGGVLNEAALLQLFLPILNGLQAVHDAGLLHLDIKPDNIYLRANQQPMLIDFGSSRQMRGDAVGKVTLTPGYCALEQYPGHGDIGAASDVYGIGAALYRCITGKNPIDALERHRVFGRTRIDPLAAAATFDRPMYHAYIRECIDRSLKLTAADRPPSAHALQQGLMGKDMTKVARPSSALLYRPGAGYIGIVLPAERRKIFRRRYTFFEKLVAISVFLVTFVVITPKFMVDTGRITPYDVYTWIDDTKSDTVNRARELGDFINERLFGVTPRPKVAPTAPTKRAKPAEAAAPAAIAPKQPFGADKQQIVEIPMPDQPPRAIGFLKHGAILAVAMEDGLVRLWDVQTAAARTTLPTRVLTPAALGVFPNTQWFAAMDRDQGIAIFDSLGNSELVLSNDPPHPVIAITVSTEGRLLAEAAEDGTVAIWELSQKRRLHSLSAGRSPAQVLIFSPDEHLLVSGDAAGGMTMWSTVDGALVSHRRAHQRAVAAAAFSPDGRLLASVDTAGDLRLWSIPSIGEDWAPGRTFADAPATVNGLAFSPDSQWLIATGAADSVYVWDVEGGTLEHRMTTDRKRLRALAVTRDGKWVAAVGDDNVVRVWK
jgi:serine/threonine protein kinase